MRTIEKRIDRGYERHQGYQGGQSGWSSVGAYQERHQDGYDYDHTGKGPRGWRRSDERLAEDVNERLTVHPDVDAGDIEVVVQDGEVTLTGTVDSRASKRLAEDIAADVSGVNDVHNRLRVGSSGA